MTESHNPPMNPQNFLIPMIEVYCVWLNKWIETDEGQTYRHTLDGFLRYNPDQNLFGQSQVLAVIPTHSGLIVQAIVSDGDDGGPSELTAWFDLDFVNGTNPLDSMVQGFDTMYQFIYNDHDFVNLPEDDR